MLGRLVRELRGLNISQRDLAHKIGVSHSYISKLESSSNASVSDDVLEKLASVLGCDRAMLYIACGRIPPDQFTIDTNASSIYTEIEHYIRSSASKINSSLEELEILFNAYNQSKTITFLINYETRTLFYMNISASLFLKRRFPGQNIDQLVDQYADEIADTSASDNSVSICNCNIKDEKILIDLRFDSFKFKNQRFLLVQIFEELSLDRFDEFTFFSKKHFKDVFENALHAIFIFEITLEDQYGALIHMNQAACDLVEYTSEELSNFIGPQNFELQSDNSSLRLKKLIQKKHFHDISIFITKNGHFVPVEIFSHIGLFGKNRFILMSCLDLNQFTKLKTEL
ncbi:helix-turn-helix domain-containing protein [Fusibacter ferrireducens]|uniref:Helix-turn-helix domain-containing protein n=1 Tax=Fusibacter ferrireducens TaxID=2785058 RepID=A0ABR9ZVG1_9FIRM|nr:helix-turn-helix domain-containing protein [Fusibacter ferrireducens]MBF4694341.1 helix-turn-helix domain-containing protein [Fusibacter ferrireducens]